MRRRCRTILSHAALVAAGVAVSGCKSSDESPPNFAPVSDAGFERPPEKMVILDVAPNLGAYDAPGSGDAAKDTAGGKDAPTVDAAVDTEPPDASEACSLILQDCPTGLGCYRVGAGRTKCQKQEPMPTTCGEDLNCPPGSVCFDSATCQPICSAGDPGDASVVLYCFGEPNDAGTRSRCHPLPLYPGVGACEP